MTKFKLMKWETLMNYQDNGNFAYIKSNFSPIGGYYYSFVNNTDYNIEFELRDTKHKKPDDNLYTVYFTGVTEDGYKSHEKAKRFSTLEEAMEYVKENN
tara:strand:+ start:224 stop:520 length:297 start_codon:yes stop_codon:yes gene_type:complete